MSQTTQAAENPPIVYRSEYTLCIRNHIQKINADLSFYPRDRSQFICGMEGVDQIGGFMEFRFPDPGYVPLISDTTGQPVSIRAGWCANHGAGFLVFGKQQAVEQVIAMPVCAIRYERFCGRSGALLLLDLSFHDAETSLSGWKIPVDPADPRACAYLEELAGQGTIPLLAVPQPMDGRTMQEVWYYQPSDCGAEQMAVLEEAKEHAAHIVMHNFDNACIEYRCWQAWQERKT